MGLTNFEYDTDELYEIDYIDGKFCKVGYPADEYYEEEDEYETEQGIDEKY